MRLCADFNILTSELGRHRPYCTLQGLREHSVVLMGKNTMMKRCIKVYAEEKQEDKWNVLLDYLVGNVGIIFTTVRIFA